MQRRLAPNEIHRINPIKNIQALECAKKIRAQRSYCATCVAVILLLQPCGTGG